MNRKVLLLVAIPLALSCVCIGVLAVLGTRSGDARAATRATASAGATQFLDPLRALCTGQSNGVGQAAAIGQGAGVRPMIAFRTTTANNYSQDTRIGTGEWAVRDLASAQLVSCAEESWPTIETCPYKGATSGTTSYVDRTQQQVKLRLIAAKTGQVVATQTFKGGEPRQCGEKETFASGANRFTVAGEAVSPATIQAWLKPHVAP